MGKVKAGRELLETGLGSLGKKVSPFKYRQELIKNNLVSLRKANPEMTFERGTIIRGKYTLPKRLAFAVNVPEVDVRQLEK